MTNEPTKRWYVRDHFSGQPRQIWRIENGTATRMGVTNPEAGAGTYFKADPGENILDCIRRLTPWLNPGVTEGQFYPAGSGPGEFHPRMARPIALAVRNDLWSPWMETDFNYVANSRGQLTLLVRKLEIICQTVQPNPRTLDAYGHEIRNLLILAATEVEMHCRGILTANGSLTSKFNSNEYVKLADPLKLREYAIAFRNFPEIQQLRPFSGWEKDNPSKSLAWYDAFNGVKHNREHEFERGTLRHATEAVSACLAVFVAQFGPAALSAEMSNLFSIEFPTWSISEMYLPPVDSATLVPVNYPGL